MNAEELVKIEPTGTSGIFQFSGYGEGSENMVPLRHTSVYVNNSYYSGAEDNDLRGFLDGRFKNGWNQPSQTHVRMGRREMSKYRGYFHDLMGMLVNIPGVSHFISWVEPAYPYLGEHELFRILHRWDGINLPPNARITNARMELTIEYGPPFDAKLYLYSVNKDWKPGRGGVSENNISPPKKGEVWWQDIAYKERAWGLPGVGFASDEHPDADVPAQPLASTNYNPGTQKVEFSSDRLLDYISLRVREQKPLLFLIKLSDFKEDTPGSRISTYSAEYGDNRNVERRPYLYIEWESSKETQQLEKSINLEYGRTCILPRIDISEATTIMASFIPKHGFESPTIEVRGGSDEVVSPWTRVIGPFENNWKWIEFKIISVIDPIILGHDFKAQIRDTWIETGPPEDQKVEWIFLAPTGKVRRREANYLGKYIWEVNFQPDEIGRWDYYWKHSFSARPYSSSKGSFDVIIQDQSHIKRELQILSEKIKSVHLKTHYERAKTFGVTFMKLQRAALQLETPQSFTTRSGRELRETLDDVRGLIWGIPIPKSLPLQSLPRDWEG